jgi:PAS domain S-box-containing protein
LQVSVEREELIFHAFLHDITGRMVALAEMERQRREIDDEHAFLQAVLDNLDTGVAACDSAGNLTFFNRALREVHGRDAAPGANGETWARAYDLYAPDGRTLLTEDEVPLARAHAGEIVRGAQLVVKSGGDLRRFVSNARPIDAPDGRRLGAVVAMNDITDIYRAEELRRARHAVAQVLSEATSAEEAGIGAVSAIADAMGWLCGEYWQVTEDRQEVVRLSSRAAPDRDISAFTNDQPLTFGRGEGLPGVVWMRGTEVWSSSFPDDIIGASRLEAIEQVGIRTAVGLPVRSGRRVVGVLAFYTDTEVPHNADIAAMLDSVSAHLGRFVERRRAEDLTLALAAARREFDRVVEQVNDYVWTVEVIPGEPGRLVYGSPNATGVFGGTPRKANERATAITDRIHLDDADRLEAFHSTLAAGHATELECRIVGYDDVARWVWTRAVPRREGSRLFIDGISTNVNDRRELDEQREHLLAQQQQQMDQLRELDRMKDELAAVVIHELRNPVGVIRGYTEMLLDSTHLDETDRRHATVVDRSTVHLQRLVDDLLDLARLDAGHISIDPRPMPAGRLIRDVLENHRPSAAAKSLTITEELDPHLPVHADAQRLRQALDNLLSNAIKYTPDGGTITITAERRGESVAIAIRDTGIGIPAEQYEHLFSRFFRASNATKKGIKGTGLGLAVTKAIIEAHDGTLSAAPAPGGGTVFTLVLPTQELVSAHA